MKENRGFSMIEILVSFIILALVVAGALASYTAINKLTGKDRSYRYTAINLARKVLEFGEAGTFVHPFSMRYKWGSGGIYADNPALSIHPAGYDGFETYTGYDLKEWHFFCPEGGGRPITVACAARYPHPFEFIGDIQAEGLAPKGKEQSVEIYYKVDKVGMLDGVNYDDGDADHSEDPYIQTVEVIWEDEDGVGQKVVLSNIAITQVNNQLKLKTAEFYWD